MADTQKRRLIDQIIRLQQDFQALTNRTNALQHENEYFEMQLQDFEQQLLAKRQSQLPLSSSIEPQPEWPVYIKADPHNLPQRVNQFVKFYDQQGNSFVQYIQIVQNVQKSQDGKSQVIMGEEMVIVQTPLQLFEQQFGPYDSLGVSELPEEKVEEKYENKQ